MFVIPWSLQFGQALGIPDDLVLRNNVLQRLHLYLATIIIYEIEIICLLSDHTFARLLQCKQCSWLTFSPCSFSR